MKPWCQSAESRGHKDNGASLRQHPAVLHVFTCFLTAHCAAANGFDLAYTSHGSDAVSLEVWLCVLPGLPLRAAWLYKKPTHSSCLSANPLPLFCLTEASKARFDERN